MSSLIIFSSFLLQLYFSLFQFVSCCVEMCCFSWDDVQNGAVEGAFNTSRGHHLHISRFVLPHLRKSYLHPCTCPLHQRHENVSQGPFAKIWQILIEKMFDISYRIIKCQCIEHPVSRSHYYCQINDPKLILIWDFFSRNLLLGPWGFWNHI